MSLTASHPDATPYALSAEEALALGFPRGNAGTFHPYPGAMVVVGERVVPFGRLRTPEGWLSPTRRRITRGLRAHPYLPGLELEAGPIHVFDDEAKALAAHREGVVALALPSPADAFDPSVRQPLERRPLHPALTRVSWSGRQVHICLGSTWGGERGQGLDLLSERLDHHGAIVHWEVEQQGETRVLRWAPRMHLLLRLPVDFDDAPAACLAPLRRAMGSLRPDARRRTLEALHELRPSVGQAPLATLGGQRALGDSPDEIVVNDRQIRDIARDAWAALRRSPQGQRVYALAGGLVLAPADRSGGPPRVLDIASLTALLHRAATWIRETSSGTRHCAVRPEVVRDMLALPDPDLPALQGVVDTPILRRDGDLITKQGFDPDSGLLHLPDHAITRVGHVSMSVERARSLLLEEWLGDFPFARPSDRAHALAAVLLPLLRHWVDGSTPLHLVEAPTEGTGKSLLVELLHLVATGESSQPLCLSEREEEVRKSITSTLVGCPRLISWDNINHRLDSPALAAVLTTTSWRDRLLGSSRNLDLPNRAVWLATANNPRLSRELARRTVRIRLDASVQRPWMRTDFRHADITGWTRAHRGELVSAALSLARAWLDAGSPAGPDRLGSFGTWSEVIGGVLHHADVPGFLDDLEAEAEPVDPHEELWSTFLAAWHEALGPTPRTAAELFAWACEHGHLGLAGQPPTRGARMSFAKKLALRRDRVFDGLQLRVERCAHRRQNTYLVHTLT